MDVTKREEIEECVDRGPFLIEMVDQNHRGAHRDCMHQP